MNAEERRSFYSSCVQTYLERDVATLEGVRNLEAFATFTRLLAARTGQPTSTRYTPITAP